MTKIAFIGDLHLGRPKRFGGPVVHGINDRGRMVLDVLRTAVHVAEDAGADVVVLLGDFYDDMHPAPQLIAAAKDILAEVKIQKVLLKGNHDSASDDAGDNGISMMRADDVEVVDTPRVLFFGDAALVCCPFRNGRVIDWLPGELAGLCVREVDAPRTVLTMHAGIRIDSTAPWLLESPDAIDATALQALMDEHGIQYAFAGNWHERMRVGQIYQMGAVCPTGFNNPGVHPYGWVAILDEKGKVSATQVPGPRFIKCAASDLDTLRALPPGNIYFIESEAEPDEYEQAKLELGALKASGAIREFTLHRTSKAAKEATARAASAAKRASAPAEAVDAFVGRLELPAGVKKEIVLSRTLRYLGA